MTVSSNIDTASKTLKISVSGRFDFSVHQQFRKASDLAGNNVNAIVVDMGSVDYMDSSALGMLLVLRDKVSGNSKNAITIKGCNPEVGKVLEIAKFNQLFTIE